MKISVDNEEVLRVRVKEFIGIKKQEVGCCDEC